MNKTTVALLLILALAASCLSMLKPAFSQNENADAGFVENTWTQKAPMQQARSELGVAVVKGKIYAIGGSTLAGSYPYTGGIIDTNEEYNPATNTWSFKKPMPTPRKNFGIAVYNNKIYCIGGEEIFKDEDRAPLSNATEVYDPATDTWETKESMPTPRSDLQANVVNGKIYLIGGKDPNVHFRPGASTHNEVYDPSTDLWSTKEPLPAPTSNFASAVFDDKIYVIGGYIEGPWLRFDLNQIYDTRNDSWSNGAPLIGVFGTAAGVITTGCMAPKRIYVFGGNSSLKINYIVRSYDPKNDSWTVGADMLTGRGSVGVAVVNDLIYVIGGETSSGIPFMPDTYVFMKYATNEVYYPFGYGSPDPSYRQPEEKAQQEQIQPFMTLSVILWVSAPIAIAVLTILLYWRKTKHSKRIMQAMEKEVTTK